VPNILAIVPDKNQCTHSKKHTGVFTSAAGWLVAQRSNKIDYNPQTSSSRRQTLALLTSTALLV